MSNLRIDQEPMNGDFTKYHLRGPWPFHPVLHHFRAPDHGDPHDHPWPFRSVVLAGGYVEEVFSLDGSSSLVRRNVGESFVIPAGHIHRIVELPEGECWTLITALGPQERVSGFYRFGDGEPMHRFWNEPEFMRPAREVV